jgi:APA family basic amino acid/polyamine antiporter
MASPPPVAADEPTRTLARTLGLRDLVMITIGTVIGSGIFIVPAETLRASGEYAGLAMLVWIVGGVLSLLGALTYAELGAMTPDAGGIYVYIRDAFGPLAAFLYGWVMFLAIGPATVAALTVAAVSYMRELVPLGPLAGTLVALLLIAIVFVVNVRSTRTSADVQNVGTLIKTGALLLLSVLLLVGGSAGPGARLWPEDLGAGALTSAGGALIAVLWAYEGWQWLTFSAGEAKDPQRTFPQGIILGTASLVVLYLLANLAYLQALGPAAAAASPRVAAQAVAAVLGGFAGKLIAAIIVVSTFSASISSTLTGTRVFYAMAKDGVFFAKLAEVHPRYGTPAWCVGANCALGALFAATGSFSALITYVVFIAWIFYGWGALSVYVLRRRFPDAVRPFRVPGYPVTPALFVLSALALVVSTIALQPERASVGLLVTASGVPMYYVWRSRRGRAGAPLT